MLCQPDIMIRLSKAPYNTLTIGMIFIYKVRDYVQNSKIGS